MALAKTLTDELTLWGILAVLLVIFMVILGGIKTSGNGQFICFADKSYYNTTADVCCTGTATTVGSCDMINQTAIGTMGNTVDDFITGLSEPKNWVAIFVIALIGFGIIKFVSRKE